MSNKVKFKLDVKGLNELMKSAPMQATINSAAAQIAGSAGDGFAVESAHPISFVAIGSVYATDYLSRKKCYENNALLKAAGGAKI